MQKIFHLARNSASSPAESHGGLTHEELDWIRSENDNTQIYTDHNMQ